jgi:aminoglycoside phosphotransferase (APT) family kinase protein
MENTFVDRMLAFGPMLWYQYDYDASHLWSKVHVNEDIVNYLWGEVFRVHDLTPDLILLKMPIDVILGKYDFFNPPDLWKNVQNPFIKIHVLESAGHTPQLEEHEAFDEILVERPQEVNITVELVRRLIDSQFPQWSQLPITPVAESGWDNRTFHLGDELSIRLPSAQEYHEQVEKEQKWLPKIAPHLPLPISQPIAQGVPTEEFPWNWSIYKWLEGVSANQLSFSDNALETIAVQLAQFLAALHQYDPDEGPIPGLHNWWRGAHPSVYDLETQSLINELKEFIDPDKATLLWNRAISSTWQHDPVWVHGDVASGNILIKDDKISAIIDFGCMGVGDPACDLTIAWTFFKGNSRKLFKENLPLDEETWARARGWALWKALYQMSQLKEKSGAAFAKQQRIIKDVMDEHLK